MYVPIGLWHHIVCVGNGSSLRPAVTRTVNFQVSTDGDEGAPGSRG